MFYITGPREEKGGGSQTYGSSVCTCCTDTHTLMQTVMHARGRRYKEVKVLSYGLTSPTCAFVVVDVLNNQQILIHSRVKWSSKNDISLFLIQSLQIFDPAHM